MGVLLFFDPHKMGQLMIFSKAKVHLFSTCYCNIHLQAPGAPVPHSHPSWAKLSANLSAGFLPAKLETGSWNVSAIGKPGPLFSHTHGSAGCQGTVLQMRKKIPWHNYSFRSLPKRWGRGIDLAKGGANLQLMWSEWDRLSAGMTADDGVIKYLP